MFILQEAQYIENCGRVAQLDRALASGAKGRGFESRSAHHESIHKTDALQWHRFFHF